MTDAQIPLTVSFQDDALVVVDKPCGLLVHRSVIDARETTFLLQTLRDQLNQPLFPVHRLDKATSGLVIFALSSDVARTLSQAFEHGDITKTYEAFVRGHTPQSLHIDHALRDEVMSSHHQAVVHPVAIERASILMPPNQLYLTQLWAQRIAPMYPHL